MAGNLQKYYDVVIVGAGPAGANLCRMLDSHKYKTLLIDGSEGREKVCGGLLSPDAQDILAKYDISLPKSILVSPQLFSVKTIDLSDGLTRHYRRSYMNIDRQKFDEFIIDMARGNADIVNARCENIKRAEDGFTLDVCSSTRERIYCKYIVGADGASSIVRRTLFGDRKIHKYTAIQQWFDAGNEKPYYSCIFDNETSSGCSWIFFKDGKIVFGGAFDKQNCRWAFEEQKRKLVSLGFVSEKTFEEPVKTEACLVARPKIGKGIFMGADGAFLIGEAAGLISPSSFEGISFALSSAEILAGIMNDCDDRSKMIKKYKARATRLKIKIYLRVLKRPFMYNKILRRAVMKSGVQSMKVDTL